MILTSHYRSEQNLTIKSLKAARKARQSLYRYFSSLDVNNFSNHEVYQSALKVLQTDIDSAGSLALIRFTLKNGVEKKDLQSIYNFVRDVLGITFDDLNTVDYLSKDQIPNNIKQLLLQREEARTNKDYQVSDELRSEIEGHGYIVTDKNNDQVITKK